MALSKKLEALILKEYGEFVDIYARISDVEEFTDIKYSTVQALMNWSAETGEDFNKCVAEFQRQFNRELLCLKKQGFPQKRLEGVYRTAEHPDS